MIESTLRRTVPLVLALAVAAAAPTATAAAATTAAAAAVPAASATAFAGIRGWARMAYGDPRDDVRILVDAHGSFDGRDPAVAARSWGTFRIQHFMGGPSDGSDGPRPGFNWGDFRVDCVRVDGADVAVTGRLVDAGPDWEEFLHGTPPARMGVSFHVAAPGTGETRIGITAPPPAGAPELAPCAAGPADAGTTAGGYTLTDTRRRSG
ncbi:hypothetical protein ACFZBM_35920 [Streptomyces lavendulae]|uniref:hypothetical protein n=1 Tax=Streptomyces lavendulae TaxID=1914 RepID=UPI0036E40F79